MTLKRDSDRTSREEGFAGHPVDSSIITHMQCRKC
jgi:hypothetical protein